MLGVRIKLPLPAGRLAEVSASVEPVEPLLLLLLCVSVVSLVVSVEPEEAVDWLVVDPLPDAL